MSDKWIRSNKGKQQSKKKRKQNKQVSYLHKVAHTRAKDKLDESNDEKAERAIWVKKEHGEEGMRMCGSKRKYASQAEAQRSIDRRQADYPMRVYECPICGGWHITHKPKQKDESEKTDRTSKKDKSANSNSSNNNKR